MSEVKTTYPTGYATCTDCDRVMVPGGGCALTHVSKTSRGKQVKRIVVSAPGDFMPGDNADCHDCNAGPGKPHHPGCDAERCPECGMQMLGCLGEAEPGDQYPGCGWKYLAGK